MPTLVLANQKGGVGKTALACSLSWWLVERKRHRVLFVDLDAQGNASRTLGRCEHASASLALFDDRPVEVVPTSEPITLMAASPGLSDVDGQPRAPVQLQAQLASIGRRFDSVIIDTPPALGRRMIAALVAADAVLCPIELEDYSIDGAVAMLKTIHAVRARWNPRLRCLGLLANRFNHHSTAQKIVLTRLLREHHARVVPARVAIRSSIALSLSEGVPVWRLPQSAAREAAAELEHAFQRVWERFEKCTECADA